MNLAHIERLPDWPARMPADVAAIYMGISKTSFLTRFGECAVREGGNTLWARRQLDAIIDKQFSLAQRSGAAVGEDDSWDDVA